ncbi:MAG: hypothetical protein FJ294_14355 [Planctomycetes bacterium]|nr:hypothetical protein [Planctomycetota bacterium]
MSDPKNGRSVARDALGILGMVIGVFGAVSVVMAHLRPVTDGSGEPTGFFMGVVALIGPIAGVFGALGVALIGVRLWLSGLDGSTPRHLVGIALTTFMLAILVGTLDESLAGSFGGVIGSAVRQRFSVWVAVPTGLALVLLPAWFAWLRPAELHARRENPGTPASALTESTDASGVTACEAEALLKNPAPEKTAPAPAAATSPYPPDIRPTGGIPAGARPLETPHGRASSSSHDFAHQQPTACGASAALAGAAGGLAGSWPTSDAVAEAPSAGSGSAAVAGGTPRELAAAQPLAADEDAAITPELPARDALGQPHYGSPSAPSWEQPDLFDEPVDAYGTPMSLVESLRKGAASGADELAVAEEESTSSAPAGLDLSGVDLGDDADIDSIRPLGVNVLAPTSLPAAEPPAAEVVASDEPASDEPATDEPATDEPATAQATPVESAVVEVASASETSAAAPFAAEQAPTAEAEQPLFDEEQACDESEAELAPEASESLERVASEDDAKEPVQPSLFAELVLEPARKHKGRSAAGAALATEPRAAPSTASIVPTPAASGVHEPAAADEPESLPSLSDTVLTPAPARSISRVFLPEPTYRAGCLFLERNRVAVSMLQRELQMDFKVATAVLDQLQDIGLIGPYLGGQRRDILMSVDEWQEKVGVAE